MLHIWVESEKDAADEDERSIARTIGDYDREIADKSKSKYVISHLEHEKVRPGMGRSEELNGTAFNAIFSHAKPTANPSTWAFSANALMPSTNSGGAQE